MILETCAWQLIFSVFYQAPVEDAHESPEECYQEAEVAMTPDPDREGKEHDPDDGDVGGAVQEHHHVHQGELLHLRKCIFFAVFGSCKEPSKSLCGIFVCLSVFIIESWLSC